MSFEFYYKDNTDDEAQVYYHNLLVIISKSNLSKGIDFFNKMPDYPKNDNRILHLYSMILIDQEKYEEAQKILEYLYFVQKYEDAFGNLIKTYILLNMYKEVVEMLTCEKSDKFDNYGFLASIYIISKSKIKKYSESELIKLNNSKFKKMPLYYFCSAELLYNCDRRKKKYIEQLKKGMKHLRESDVVAIETMCQQARQIGLEEQAISYFESIELSPFLQNKLLELLSQKNELTKNEIDIVENVLEIYNNNIDLEYLNAKVLESKGKELSAIARYKKSFINTKNGASAFGYIQLSIKNRAKIDVKLIEDIKNFNKVDYLMLVVEAYNYMGNYDDAVKCSYKAIYMSRNIPNFSDSFKQFWLTMTFYNSKISTSTQYVTNDCVVILTNNSTNLIFLLEDDDYFEVGEKILNAEIIRTDSDIGIELLHLKKGDNVNIENVTYNVSDVFDKYSYLARSSFKYIKDDKSVKFYTSTNDKSEEFIEQLRQDMIIINNDVNRRLDVYQESKNIPLSALISNKKDFDEYAKLLNTLLSEKNRVLFAGETIDLNLKFGFVIDISSLIILSMLDILDIIPDTLLSKIYITTSLKNKFKYFYEKLLKKSDDKESNLYIIDDKLTLNESLIINQIKFWKKLNCYIDKFCVVDIESEKDKLLNNKTLDFFDKIQFDLISLAKERNMPLVSDDLMIRKICNTYKVNHTNTMQIIKCFSQNHEEYIEIFLKLSKMNYIYTLFSDNLSKMIEYIYKNYSKKSREEFTKVIDSVLDNEVCLEFYVPILLNRINNLKSVQYIQLFNQVYENLVVTFVIDSISNIINKQCEKYKVDINDIVSQ